MLQCIQSSKQPGRGFTLLELLVVISIMLMIAGAGGCYTVNSGSVKMSEIIKSTPE